MYCNRNENNTQQWVKKLMRSGRTSRRQRERKRPYSIIKLTTKYAHNFLRYKSLSQPFFNFSDRSPPPPHYRMESAAFFPSFQCSLGTVSHMPFACHMQIAAWPASRKSSVRDVTFDLELVSSPLKRAGVLVARVNTSDTAVISKSDDKNAPRGATFPSGFEALVLDVCDETEIAELKLKVGDFEMHLKRNIGAAEAPVLAAVSTPPPPSVSELVAETISASPPSPTKPASEKSSPFIHVPLENARKIAALEASGNSGYVLVASPTVGAFRKNRTVKGKTLPPLLKQGDIVKEGQVICYLDQFSKELPVQSDAAGEVIKILFDEGEAVGYGDPLIAVHPSFHNTK